MRIYFFGAYNICLRDEIWAFFRGGAGGGREGELGGFFNKIGFGLYFSDGLFWACRWAGQGGAGRGGAGGIMPSERGGIWSFLLIWLVHLRDAAARYPPYLLSKLFLVFQVCLFLLFFFFTFAFITIYYGRHAWDERASERTGERTNQPTDERTSLRALR